MRRAPAVFLCAAACLLPAVVAVQAQAPKPPQIRFEPQAVVAEGISPGKKVVFFSIAREVSGYATTTVHRQEILSDADGKGIVRFELGREVPFKSVWFAVDLDTGQFAVAAPEGFPLREVPFPARAIPAALNRLELQRSLVEVVLVRPAVGAWAVRVGDGGALDEDREADGTLRAALSNLTPLGESPAPPERLRPDDLLLVIDPQTLVYLTARLRI